MRVAGGGLGSPRRERSVQLEHERAALRQQPEPFAGGGRRLDGHAACPEAEVACEALELCVDKAAALTCAETVLGDTLQVSGR